MKLAVLILNNMALLDRLLEELLKAGIKGGTIVDSQGMARRISENDQNDHLLGVLKELLISPRPFNKTLLFVIKEEQLEAMKNVVDYVTGGLDQPNTGLLFCINLSDVFGINS